jgi:dienelactone hydrolase
MYSCLHRVTCSTHEQESLGRRSFAARWWSMIRAWRFTRSVLLAKLALVIVVAWSTFATGAASRVSIPRSDGSTLPAFLITADSNSSQARPGVVVASNAGGAKLLQYHEYCRKLADSGFVVLLIDASNFPESLTPGPDTWRRMPYHVWSWVNHLLVVARLTFGHGWYVGNIDAAVNYLRSLPSVDPSRIALSGFSQSANASLCYASNHNGKVKCLVWNNGGWPWIMPYNPSTVPSVLILHGEEDGVYSVDHARRLSSELKDAGRDVECFIYPTQRHMFMVYYDLEQPSDAANPALVSSFERLCAFLDRTIGEGGGPERASGHIDRRPGTGELTSHHDTP